MTVRPDGAKKFQFAKPPCLSQRAFAEAWALGETTVRNIEAGKPVNSDLSRGSQRLPCRIHESSGSLGTTVAGTALLTVISDPMRASRPRSKSYGMIPLSAVLIASMICCSLGTWR